MKVSGGCHCGAIRYEAEVEPNAVGICHCTDCQALSGSAFRVTARATPGSFRLLSGAPRVYTKTAESGAKREQAFCERCGSPLYANSPGNPSAVSLRVGTIDQRAALRPALQLWTRSQLPWLEQLGAIPRVEKQRP